VALLLFPTCTDAQGAKEKPPIVQKDSHEAEFERMSDEELIKAIEERANKLGIKINLRYDFGSGRSDDAQ
jgi:hypothetical protein